MSGRYDNLDKEYWDENKPDMMQSAHTSAKWAMEFVRPSVMARSPRKGGQPQTSVRRTAYLDGLRGFAAFLVYWHHHQLYPNRNQIFATRLFENGYGFEDQYFFAALPGVRLFFTGGHFAVAVFFVISGYVLAAKPLSLIYAGDFSKLGDNLASALFRRWIRLHVPIIFVTFIYMTSWHAFGLWTVSPEHKATWREEVWNWYTEFKNFSFVFRTGGESWFTYNFPTWTIPVEFRGSLVVYTALLAFSRASRNARLLCTVGLMFYFMYIADGWFGATFLAGMLLCELDTLEKMNELPEILTRIKSESGRKLTFYLMFAAAIYLGGVPSHLREMETLTTVNGWYYLSFLKPQAVFDFKWFYLFWAAIFLVASIPRIPWLRSFFELSFNQYLGRISFALYLVHGPILWTLGDRLYTAVGFHREEHVQNIPGWVDAFPLNKSGPMGFELAFWLPHLIILPVTLWVAEIVTKIFDEPSVRFAAWAYDRTLAPSVPLL